ncbi:MAG TPA: hypothetical protein VLV49_16480 [Terriglobales bacterium]|nr:hypothetical protein [Terriglobales bacterium]
MKRNLFGTLSLVALALVLGSVAQAQVVKGDVPFGFTVGNTQLPAGCYRATYNDLSRTAIFLSNCETGRQVLALTSSLIGSSNIHPKLVFHQLGTHYFLREVWGDGGRGVGIAGTKLEKEMQAANNASTDVIVAMTR